ncbi:MAG: DEAD/DEAH box helicase [Solirubrobacteraceae bacterium]
MTQRRPRAGFRRSARQVGSAANPRELFRDLPRDPDIPYLWEHQGRILERYEDRLDTGDVALELPTGTGKTLIGLLIAEWRRRTREERALYLCPTRQLAYQVGAQAPRYGIQARVCLAPNYDGLEDWQEGRAVAVSTYSSLFNYRPKFTAPEALVLDDAHAADEYVASHWTTCLDRHEMPKAYARMAALLDPLLDRRMAGLITDDQPRPGDRATVELVPLPRWWPLANAVRELLEEEVQGTGQFFAWDDHVRKGLAACCLLVSWQEIVLRPLVPATAHQAGFAGATQRIYMSATLGAGGELERIFGVQNIERLPVPEEWQRHSTGRRLFLLPGASLRRSQVDQLVLDAVTRVGRTLVLAPTRDGVVKRREALAEAGITTLGASDIEESVEPFTSKDKAALVLANRYDGLDLPGDDCRLLVLDGLPVAVNILERFLFSRLAATGLLAERMRTRLTQGVGRCSRGEGDWCAVLVASREAYDFCARKEVRALLHPELQGELRFGLDQSGDRQPEDFMDLLELLLERGDEWGEADAEIRELRDEAVQQTDPAAKQLQAAVADEVGFVYAMWNGDYPRALERACAVADELGGEPAAAYRAWWLYQAGSAAWLAFTTFGMEDMTGRARDLFARAAATGRAVGWFAELAYGQLGERVELEANPDDLRAAERAHERLRRLGFNGHGFSRETKRIRDRLDQLEPTPYEEGLTSLGRLLGFDADHPGGDNNPDSVWVASERLAIVWEAKSEERAGGEVGARTAQQAAGHAAWVRAHRNLADDAKVLALLISDRERMSNSATIHAGDVCVVGLDEVLEMADRAVAALARVRARGQAGDDVGLRALLVDELKSAGLLPTQLYERLGRRRLADLPVGG